MEFIIPAGDVCISQGESVKLVHSITAFGKRRNIYYASNGSGKTVLFRWLAGQSDSSAYKSDRFVKISGADVLLPLNKVCAFVPQSARDCLFGLPGYEELHATPFVVDKSIDTDFLIDELELEQILNKFTFELSDGEQKRIMVASALRTRAEWMIMDEWDLHLDTTWKNKISTILDKYVNFNRGTLEFVSHRLPSCEEIQFLKMSEREVDVSTVALRMIPMSKMPVLLRHSGVFGNGDFKRSVSELEFSAGSITAIIGRNGTGKTTLLRSLRTDKFSKSLNRNMAFVLTDPAIQMPVQPVSYIINRLNIKDTEGIAELLHIIDIELHKNIWHLNYARKKLLAVIVQAIKNDEILIIDELEAGLDKKSKKIMLNIVNAAKRRGKCIIVTVHSEDQLDGLDVDKKVFL